MSGQLYQLRLCALADLNAATSSPDAQQERTFFCSRSLECVIKVSLQDIAHQNACSALLDADDELCNRGLHSLICTDMQQVSLSLDIKCGLDVADGSYKIKVLVNSTIFCCSITCKQKINKSYKLKINFK